MDSFKKGKYLTAAFFSAAIWGFFAIPLRNLKGFVAEEILYNRIFMSFGVIWLTIFVFKRSRLLADLASLKSATKKDWRIIACQILGAALLLTFNWYTYIYVINSRSLKVGAFAYMVCPLITALGGFLILKENLSKLKLISLVIALISIIMLASGSVVDVLWAVIVAALYAFYLIIQRKTSGFDKLNVLAIQITLIALIALPTYILKGFTFSKEPFFWANIFLISTLFTIIPLFLSLYALIGIPSSTMGIIIYVNPIIAFLVAVIYFNERISADQFIAYGLLMFAVVLFNWQAIKEILKYNKKRGFVRK